MTELVEFLKARVDEDEQAAWETVTVEGHGWSADGPFGKPEFYHVQGGYDEPVAVSLAKSAAAHVVRYQPARVLRELAAKRAMIAQFVDQSCMSCSSSTGGDDIGDCVARMLASVYSDHPDFKADWAI